MIGSVAFRHQSSADTGGTVFGVLEVFARPQLTANGQSAKGKRAMNRSHRSFVAAVAVAFVGLFATTGPAASADLGPSPPAQLAAPAPPPSQWQFSFTPYG